LEKILFREEEPLNSPNRLENGSLQYFTASNIKFDDFPTSIDPLVLDILKGCLKKNPEERMTARELLNNAWLI